MTKTVKIQHKKRQNISVNLKEVKRGISLHLPWDYILYVYAHSFKISSSKKWLGNSKINFRVTSGKSKGKNVYKWSKSYYRYGHKAHL